MFSVWRRSFSLLSLFHIYLPLDQPFHWRCLFCLFVKQIAFLLLLCFFAFFTFYRSLSLSPDIISFFYIYLPLDQPFHRRWKKPGITSLFPHIYLHNHSDPFFLFLTLLLSPCVKKKIHLFFFTSISTSSVSLCEEAASLSQPTRHYHCPLQYQHFPVATLLICLVGKSRPFKFSSKLFL